MNASSWFHIWGKENDGTIWGNVGQDNHVYEMDNTCLLYTSGADYAKGDGTVYVPAYAAQSYNKDESLGGSDYKYEMCIRDRLCGHQRLQDALCRCHHLRRAGRHRRHGLHRASGADMEL